MRNLLGGLLYLLTINEKFYKVSFLSQILAMVIFCFPPISVKGIASGNICKTSFIERYKWQTSYRPCIKFVLEKFVFSTLLIFYFISCEVDRRTQPSSHIIMIRVGLDLSCMTRIFKKFIDLCETWPKPETAHEKSLAPRVSIACARLSTGSPSALFVGSRFRGYLVGIY